MSFESLYYLVTILACLSAALATAAAAAERPNIIYIVSDDLGYGDLGCYGQMQVRTPRLDQMAAEGLRFTDHYAGHTVCRPSRLVFLTGKHTAHTAIAGNNNHVLPAGSVTVTSLLQEPRSLLPLQDVLFLMLLEPRRSPSL